METTKLSTKGQVIIPKAVRAAHGWGPGLELTVLDTGDGVLLRPKTPFPPASLDDVAGMLGGRAPKKTDAQIEAALRRSARRQWRGRD